MAEDNVKKDEKEENTPDKRYETRAGLTIAFLAAMLAITDLGAGKFGDDEIIASNEKANAYNWYQAKSIKQNLKEGERDTLKTLLLAGSINKDQVPVIDKYLKEIDSNIFRYKKEKNEILSGSKAVGESNWAQDVDGKLGMIKGAKEWESKQSILNEAGDIWDFATLFLQLSLVIGAIGLVLKQMPLKKGMYYIMAGLGIVGIAISAWAFSIAFRVL